MFKKKILTLLILFLIIPNISQSKVSTKSSHEMHGMCKKYVEYTNGKKLEIIDSIKSLNCSWYFKGMFESSGVNTALGVIRQGGDTKSAQMKINGVCVPDSITPEQWVKMFVRYLDQNPQYLSRGVALNATTVLTKYFKCRK